MQDKQNRLQGEQEMLQRTRYAAGPAKWPAGLVAGPFKGCKKRKDNTR